MIIRSILSLVLLALVSAVNPDWGLAAEKTTVDIEAGPISDNEHAKKRCPEVVTAWMADNPGFRAEWTGHWTTTVPGEMSVCQCAIVEEPVEVAEEPIEIVEENEVGGDDLRVRRGYSHAWINEEEEVSVLYFFFDNGVLQFYRDEPGMGHVFKLDLSGLPDPRRAADDARFEDTDDDGYADVKIPLPDGRFAVWRWNAGAWEFEATDSSPLLPAPAATRTTLSALPAWTSPHLIVHLGELSELASRLGHSWLLDYTLDIRSERKGLLEWLRTLPIESLSLVKGISGDDEDAFQGAIRFERDKRDLLSRLDDLAVSGEATEAEAEMEIVELFAQLLGAPLSLYREGKMGLVARFENDDRKLFNVAIHPYFPGFEGRSVDLYASVADGGDEKLLLFASEPEGVERAKKALGDESARLGIIRRGPEMANFLQLVDDASGSLAEDATPRYFTSRAPLELDLSWGLAERGLNVSLRHNFPEIIVDAEKLPAGRWEAEDGGFAFGGGYPWFAGALSVALSEQGLIDLLQSLVPDAGAEQIREGLTRIGLDPAVIPEAVRSAGLVLGGYASMGEEAMPGGYAFLSGDPEKMRELIPLAKMLLAGPASGSLEETEREEWDFLYLPNDDAGETPPEAPLAAGMKDGVFILGILDADALDESPAIEWPESAEDGTVLRAIFEPNGFATAFMEFFAAVPIHEVYRNAEKADAEDLFEPEFWAGAFKFFAAIQEVSSIRLDMPDWKSLDLVVRTDGVDYEQVWKLMRASRAMASEE